MPGEIHRTAGMVSYLSLPRWQKEWWGCGERIGECCLLPDTMGWQWTEENFKRYKELLFFEERLIPHGPPDRDFTPVCISGEEHDQGSFLILLSYYTKRFTEALNKRDIDLSADMGGVLAHII